MEQKTEVPATEEIEVWETQTRSAVWVYIRDPRRPTGYRQTKVGGPNGTKRVRLSRDDREFTQERILEENSHLDPFTNGSLKRVDGGSNDGILTDEDLVEMLGLSEEGFREVVQELEHELSIRRLKDVVERQGTVPQLQVVQEVIEEKFKVGGTQRTVREMISAQEMAGGEIVER